MPVSPARRAAFSILLAVEKRSAYASELLSAEGEEKLSHADHRLATEIVMGVLRWRSVLDRQISTHSAHPLAKMDLEALISLRMGAYQLQFLERVPSRAVIHESVELMKHARKRSAAPFVNAVLRKLQPVPKPPADAIVKSQDGVELSDASAHPIWLVERWIEQFGFERTRAICLHDQQIPETTIRITDDSIARQLQYEGIELKSGKLLASARHIKSGDITRTKLFVEGRVAIQDEASQLVALLVGQGQNILDCCAAPGGKTRILAERNPQAKVLALELHPHRARVLRKMAPQKNVRVVTGDATKFSAGERFDRILADVPCSGTGTLARNPEIKWRLTPQDLADLQARQSAILLAAMEQLAPGGKLIYSTCSLEREENSAIVEKALSAKSAFKLLDCGDELRMLQQQGELMWADIPSLLQGPYLRTIPGVHPGDGFFAAVLTRT
jgi:16S rRNA (cytosine967-C5)-methyltransferase